jgi:glucose-6-phosphate 1-dehydrogenase
MDRQLPGAVFNQLEQRCVQAPSCFHLVGTGEQGWIDEGYVRLLADAMLSDPTLFTRADEVEAAWRLYTPLLELIEDSPWQLPIHPYESRTWGPAAADALLARDGLLWRRP